MIDTRINRWAGIIEQYKSYLPVSENTPVISLLEGNTPLVESKYISQLAGVPGLKIFLKIEGANPTGSFKDRGMTMAVTKACEAGSEAIICASTGNTSASAAAFAARARACGFKMDCFVLIPKGYVALGKLSQAMIYGARVVQVNGNFDIALNLVKEMVAKYPITLVNSINPFRLDGQKTGAFEVCDQLGSLPDFLSIPVGNAGNITAYFRGFKEYKKSASKMPRMIGFQAEGAAPMVKNKIIEKPETIATAIRIGNPASWDLAREVISESNGFVDSVTDDEIIEAYKLLHLKEGIACEPASAASVAGLIKSVRLGKIPANSTVVCVLTGNGLKDPDTAIKASANPEIVVEPNTAEIAKAIGF